MLVTLAALLSSMVVGCGDDNDVGEGSLSVLLEPEDTIVQGIEAGDSGETIQDGWAATFEKYIVTIGHVDVHLATDESIYADADDIFAVDLTKIDRSGLELWTLDGLREGRWQLSYETAGAAHGAIPHERVSMADFDSMVKSDFTYLIEGTLTNSDGKSCPPSALASVGDREPSGEMSGDNHCYDAPEVRFTFGARAETLFGPCEIDEVPGFAITAGQTESVALTIHGDHIFFNGFPTGSEGGVMRLAQWLADCDLDLDGIVTQEELEAITPADLPELDPERYQLGGATIEVETMYDYVSGQLKTQGHFQGEGECAVDGEEHEHE